LIERDQLFFSHNHHSSFFSENKIDLVTNINTNIKKSNQFLKNSSYLMVTFGSAWIYENVEHNFIVNNCHKLPLQKFRKKLLSIGDIKNAYCYTINKLAEFNADLKIIFTVSPVRHLKEGLVESQRSKAILLESIHQIIAENDNCSYFPAYEIMMDDLRDYRFYENDMIHPTQKAIEYIWQKFSECYFDTTTIKLNVEIESINKSILHKPFYPQSENYKNLLKNILEKIKFLEKNMQEKFTQEKIEIINLINA
jgi:GSCFA family